MRLLFLVLLSTMFLTATSIDTSKISVTWTAYKTPQKVAVSGSFGDIKFKFGKQKKTLAQTLQNASAVIDPMKADLKDEVKNNNIREYFFAKFEDKEIKVTLKDIVEGENCGTMLATVKMNGKSVKIPMEYTIADGILKAEGLLDLNLFKLDSARENLQKKVAIEHEGITWSQVKIAFQAPVKP